MNGLVPTLPYLFEDTEICVLLCLYLSKFWWTLLLWVEEKTGSFGSGAECKRDDGGIWDHVGSLSQCASPNSASLLWESGELREFSEATDLLLDHTRLCGSTVELQAIAENGREVALCSCQGLLCLEGNFLFSCLCQPDLPLRETLNIGGSGGGRVVCCDPPAFW